MIAEHQDAATFAAVVAYMRGRIGQRNAATIEMIRQAAHLPNRREAEELLQVRLADFPFAVVSSGRGYYRPSGPEDLNHYAASLRSRIMCLATRLRTVRDMASREGFTRVGNTFTGAPERELFDA